MATYYTFIVVYSIFFKYAFIICMKYTVCFNNFNIFSGLFFIVIMTRKKNYTPKCLGRVDF